MANEPRQGMEANRSIVAFDFDGTLTTRDSFTAFMIWRVGAARFAALAATLAPAAARYLLHRDRGRLKAAAAKAFLGDLSRAEIDAAATRFAESHARRLLRPDAVRMWKKWQALGARLVIVTASPESLIAPFARGLGADLLIGTRLAFDPDDRFTGAFEGQNCRGPEKLRRLREVFGPDFELKAAYGDTSGDAEMLAHAEEQGLRVFTTRP